MKVGKYFNKVSVQIPNTLLIMNDKEILLKCNSFNYIQVQTMDIEEKYIE